MLNKEILENEIDKYIEVLDRTESEREKEKIKEVIKDIKARVNYINYREKFEK